MRLCIFLFESRAGNCKFARAIFTRGLLVALLHPPGPPGSLVTLERQMTALTRQMSNQRRALATAFGRGAYTPHAHAIPAICFGAADQSCLSGYILNGDAFDAEGQLLMQVDSCGGDVSSFQHSCDQHMGAPAFCTSFGLQSNGCAHFYSVDAGGAVPQPSSFGPKYDVFYTAVASA